MMKCKHVQHRLLATSGRRKPSAEVVKHLESCASCRQWQAQLARIDRGVRSVPVPDSSEAKAALIAQLLEPPVPASRWVYNLPAHTWRRVLVGLAASVIIVLAAWSLLRTNITRVQPTPAGDPLLAKVLDRNMQLANDSSPTRRVQTLAALADDLETETSSLALVARTEDLTALAKMYDDVIRKGLVEQAGYMTPDDKDKELRQLAGRLLEASIRAIRRAEEVPPGAAGPLRTIAAAANYGKDKLLQAIAVGANERDVKLAHEVPAPAAGGES
ncbi:MAG: hypothetical protein ACJ8F7_19660 [Gemmataceae bacterium]